MPPTPVPPPHKPFRTRKTNPMQQPYANTRPTREGEKKTPKGTTAQTATWNTKTRTGGLSVVGIVLDCKHYFIPSLPSVHQVLSFARLLTRQRERENKKCRETRSGDVLHVSAHKMHRLPHQCA